MGQAEPPIRLQMRLPPMAATAKWLQVRQLVLSTAIPQWHHVVYLPGPGK